MFVLPGWGIRFEVSLTHEITMRSETKVKPVKNAEAAFFKLYAVDSVYNRLSSEISVSGAKDSKNNDNKWLWAYWEH